MLLNPDPEGVRAELEALDPPSLGYLEHFGDPQIVAVDPQIVGSVSTLKERLLKVETGLLSMALHREHEFVVVPHLRTQLQGMLVSHIGGMYQLFLDLPDEVQAATRLYVNALPTREADRILTVALTIALAHRLARAEARIAELELDLQATRADAPEVKL